MMWEFDDKGRASLSSKDDIPPLCLTNGKDVAPKTITQYSCTESHRHLGVWNSPSLSMKTQLADMTTKSAAYSRCIFKSGLSKFEVWLAYFSCFIPAIAFTFAVTSFTMTQLTTLQKPAIQATLPPLGFNRNISRDIIFGCPLFGGIGLRNLVFEQGIAQLELIVLHVRTCSSQGDLFMIGLSWWHLVVGFSSSSWEDVNAHIPYVAHTWYSSLKTFLALVHGTVYIPPSYFIPWPPVRANDAMIMKCITQLPGVSRANLESFNRCRLFLGILFLMEIMAANSGALTRTAWQGTRPRFSPLLWPYRPNPGPKAWRIWRRLLAKAFLHTTPKRTTPKTKDLTLASALGNWLPGLDWIHRQSAFFYLATTGNIYQTDDNSYSIHQRLRWSRHQSVVFSATPTSTVSTLPPDSIPVDELLASDKLLAFRRINVTKVIPPQPADALTFSDYVHQLPLWD
jgi:hypothetical protein